jgi:diguanylate cyclase (GGDEF)-like protein/PAS domain S-box-containing protein
MKNIHTLSREQSTEFSYSEPSTEPDSSVMPASAKSKGKKAGGVAKFMRRKPRFSRYGGDAKELAAKVFEFSREGILITDSQMNILSVNQAFTGITGYSAEEMAGKKSSFLFSYQEDVLSSTRMREKILAEGYWQGEICGRRKGGEMFPEWLTVTTATNEAGKITHYIHLFSDITEKKRGDAQLEYLAYHDSLTGLPNRVLFNERLAGAIALAQRHNQSIAVLFLDLDGFKQINDTLGHGSGDILLQQVAQRLTQCVRESDVVARLGGDEFVILLNELSSENSVEGITKKILHCLREPFTLASQEIGVSASIGIALFPDHGIDGKALLEKADAHMYQTKIRCRNDARH